MAGLGSLVVSLGLDAAEFTSGLTRAEQQAQTASRRIAQNIDRAAALALTGITALAAAGAKAFSVLNQQAESIAGFQDLADKVGDTAEQVASLQLAADLSGTLMDTFAAASVKLTAALAKTDDESKAVGQAIKALGLNYDEFKAKQPVEQFDAIARALAGFKDGAEKTAVAVALFGKSGADLIPMLNDLADEGERQIRLTADQIAAADAYSKEQARARSELQAFVQLMTAQAIPAMSQVQQVLLQLARDETTVSVATGVMEAALGTALTVFQTLAVLGANVGFVLLGVGREIGAVAAQAAALARLDFEGFRAISAAVKEDGERAAAELAKFERRVLSIGQKLPQADYSNEGRTAAKPRRRLDISGLNQDKDKADALLKKSLEGQLQAIRAYADQLRDAYDFAQRYVDTYYADGTISLRQNVEEQQRLRAASLAATVEAFDREIAALSAYQRKTSKPEDRLDAETKIADAVRKRAEAVTRAGRENVMAARAEARELEGLERQYNDLRATILQLSGDTAGAAEIRIQQQVKAARDLLTQAGKDPAAADILGERLTKTEQLNQAQTDYGRLLEQARIAEERILLTSKQAGQTELETMDAVRGSRQETLDKMSELVVKAQELAKSLNTPEAILFADRLALEFEKASAAVDPLMEKFRALGEEAGADVGGIFSDALRDGKSLSDTIDDIGRRIKQILFREVLEKPLANYLSNIFGGNGQASGGGWIGALVGMFGGGKAIGGPTMPNTLYEVGERRPEVYDDGSRQWLLTGSRRGRIDPNPRGGGDRTLVAPITINMPEGTSRKTARQAGAELQRALAMAGRRGN